MQFVDLELDVMREPEIAHAYLREKMNFPEYYGCNLDALYDCLTEISEDTVVNLIWPPYDSTTFQYNIARVFMDASIDNLNLHLVDIFPEKREL